MCGGKVSAFWGIALVALLGTAGTVWGLNAAFNRPLPSMDYVPQEIGVYDAAYWELSEDDCRECHGENLAYRHHYSSLVREDGICEPCHDIIADPPGVIVYRNCTVSAGSNGCHDWNSPSDIFNNGWHHNSDLSLPENCVSCHNPNLIAPIGPFRPFYAYPPAVLLPSPFMCENCHWDQDVVAHRAGYAPGISPMEHAGHPSTFDHYDKLGQFIGYYEYGNDIEANYDKHHMGFRSGATTECASCHCADPNDPAWQHDNPELIRYCEICHDRGTLHSIEPHVSDTPGWEAIGFHAGGGGVDPETYRTFWNIEQCFGCHPGGPVEPEVPDERPCSPAIDAKAGGIYPDFAGGGTLVTVTGQCFGSGQGEGRSVQVKKISDGGLWTEMPISSWSDDSIEFEIPNLSLTPGNYRVRIHNEEGAWENSNQVALTYYGEHPMPLIVVPNSGTCGGWLDVVGSPGCFGHVQEEMLDTYQGVYYVVDFVSDSGETFTALKYRNWSTTSIDVRFLDFFEDSLDPVTGERNFIQDDSEPTITKCNQLEPGNYALFVRAVTFGDEDGSGGISTGDTILDVSSSDCLEFELVDGPYILRLDPNTIERGRRLKIIGIGFGPLHVDGDVRIGGKAQAGDPALGKGKLLDVIRVWNETKIVVKLKIPQKYENTDKYIWVERGGKKSNYKKLKVLPRQ